MEEKSEGKWGGEDRGGGVGVVRGSFVGNRLSPANKPNPEMEIIIEIYNV